MAVEHYTSGEIMSKSYMHSQATILSPATVTLLKLNIFQLKTYIFIIIS
jgi:hypothetical protein